MCCFPVLISSNKFVARGPLCENFSLLTLDWVYLLCVPAILCKGTAAVKWRVSIHQPNMKLVIKLSSKVSKQNLLSISTIPLYSFNCPASGKTNPGLSMRQFAIESLIWNMSRYRHYRMADLNPSTQYEIGDRKEFQGFQVIFFVGISHLL